MSASTPRVVIDTNVLISAFVFGGIPKRAVQFVFDSTHFFVSPAILEEYRRVPLELERAEKITRDQLTALLSAMAAFLNRAKMVYPKQPLKICRDVKDDMLLECCDAARADYLVTGDKDLLDLRPLEIRDRLPGLKIVKPKSFVQMTSR